VSPVAGVQCLGTSMGRLVAVVGTSGKLEGKCRPTAVVLAEPTGKGVPLGSTLLGPLSDRTQAARPPVG
jgi:hypothetical protein